MINSKPLPIWMEIIIKFFLFYLPSLDYEKNTCSTLSLEYDGLRPTRYWINVEPCGQNKFQVFPSRFTKVNKTVAVRSFIK